MLQLENQTPFVPGMFVFPDVTGIDTLYVALKATFVIGQRGVEIASEQVPLVLADEYWGEPAKSSIRYANEAHPCKPSTDIAVSGSAFAPDQKAVSAFALSVSVGSMKKILYVFGDRVWQSDLRPSKPKPILQMPLVYERSYGGTHDTSDGKVLFEPRNPLGCGFKGKQNDRDLKGKPVPNVEDPRQPIEKAGDRPSPAGLGFISPSWQPRLSYAGTYDEEWKKTRAPYLPKDFDTRYFQAAHPDLVYQGYLRGGEHVELINVSPTGVQRFTLPMCELDVTVLLARTRVQPAMNIETLLLEPSENRFSMSWRGSVPCDKQMLQIQKVVVGLRRLEGVTG